MNIHVLWNTSPMYHLQLFLPYSKGKRTWEDMGSERKSVLELADEVQEYQTEHSHKKPKMCTKYPCLPNGAKQRTPEKDSLLSVITTVFSCIQHTSFPKKHCSPALQFGVLREEAEDCFSAQYRSTLL